MGIKEDFIERISAGLRRKSVTSPSRWALQYRVMGKPFPGPWSFKRHPWLKEMHDSNAVINIGQKGAQVGFSENLLNITLYCIDVLQENCLYVLPSKTPDATDFSASRFDPALEMSSHLQALFSDVKNIGHKRAGSANLYIRGSQSRAGLKSVPAGRMFFDEYDEMNQENLSLAEERSSGQVDKATWKVSTPTVPGMGINKLYLASTQEHFCFKCPSCNKFIEYIFPESVVITAEEPDDPRIQQSYYICHECKAILPHDQKPDILSNGIWVPQNKSESLMRGFHVNQMYSCTIAPWEFSKAYLLSLRSKTAEQEFYNSKMGLPYVVKGAQVDDEQLNKCIKNYNQVPGVISPRGLITMGVDIGSYLHYEIDEWTLGGEYNTDPNISARPKVIKYGKAISFDELVKLMYDYQIKFCIIDANPDRRKAIEFAHKCYGRVHLCFYGNSVNGRTVNKTKEVAEGITVDRTSWLDQSLGRFINGTIELPVDVDLEYRQQIKAQVRRYETDKDGNPISKYITPTSVDDHYGHARNYAEIALRFALGLGVNQDIN